MVRRQEVRRARQRRSRCSFRLMGAAVPRAGRRLTVVPQASRSSTNPEPLNDAYSLKLGESRLRPPPASEAGRTRLGSQPPGNRRGDQIRCRPMAGIPDSARSVLEGRGLAHLVTLEPDGRPQVSVVWVGLDGDEIVAAHLPEHRKLLNIRRDPRVALSIEAGTHNELGLREYLVVHGRARVTEGGAPELLQRLAQVYLGPEVKFPPMDDPPPGYITRIAVERVGGVGPWAR